MMNCEICGFEVKNFNSLGCHLISKHPEVSKDEYYWKYLISTPSGLCDNCGKETVIKSFQTGYLKYCNQDCCKIHQKNQPRNVAESYSKCKQVKEERKEIIVSQCELCNHPVKSVASLSKHLDMMHSNIKKEDYYIEYLIQQPDGICKTCGNETEFIRITKGFKEFCNMKCAKDNYYSNYIPVDEIREDNLLDKWLASNDVFISELKKLVLDSPKKSLFFLNLNPIVLDKLNQLSFDIINYYPIHKITLSLKIYFLCNDKVLPICPECGVNYRTMLSIGEGFLPTCSKECGNGIISKKKYESTCMIKFGVSHPYKLREIKEKSKQTCLTNYGVEYSFQSKEVQEKSKQTSLTNYDVEYPTQSNVVKERKVQNCLDKYGVSHPLKLQEVKDRMNQTYFRNFLDNISDRCEDFEVEIVGEYTGNKNSLQCKCLKCSEIFETNWWSISHNYLKCPVCYPYKFRLNGTSVGEKDLESFVKQIISSDLVIGNTKKIIYPHELDVYIPTLNLAIEHNGLWWHNENHVGKYYHINKTKNCNKIDIDLLHIFEDEWQYKSHIVKNIIKRHVNSEELIKIDGNFEIKEIDFTTSCEFLEKYHIEGSDNFNHVRLGFFYQDELIAVMTLIESYYKYVYEILRFGIQCNYADQSIIIEEILNYFKVEYEWNEIIVNCDRRLLERFLYQKIGFKFIKDDDIKCWYIKGCKRIHHYDMDPDETIEYDKIWDCGSVKFSLINS